MSGFWRVEKMVKQETAPAQVLAEAPDAREWTRREVLGPVLEPWDPALAYEHTMVVFAGKNANSCANPAAGSLVAPQMLSSSRTPVH